MNGPLVAPGSPRLIVEVTNTDDLAQTAATFIAKRAAQAASDRGRFVIAVSGGSTPGPMLADLFARELAWDRTVIAQVDERFAPRNHPDRNLTDLQRRLSGAPAEHAALCQMPVDDSAGDRAAKQYSEQLRSVAGDPPVIDLVQLGLGTDGHTASLVPGDAVLDVSDADVAVTGTYQGRRRMTLTYPAINRAGTVVWLVAGEEKREALHGLLSGDPSLPASHVRRDAIVFTDDAALGH